MRTNVYIDGFNLYYAVRAFNSKWLDLSALCAKLLPAHNINRIQYFTAIVKARPHDLSAPVRQGIYLRALKTVPNIKIHDYGHFVDHVHVLPQCPFAYSNSSKRPLVVSVMKTDEKGSDVNLASFLLTDCFDGDYDQAVVISNDADLTKPIELVITRYHKNVTVINPHFRKYLSNQLATVATLCVPTINASVYRSCQFPPVLRDAQGSFSKPSSW